jgi:hypothetical protein
VVSSLPRISPATDGDEDRLTWCGSAVLNKINAVVTYSNLSRQIDMSTVKLLRGIDLYYY